MNRFHASSIEKAKELMDIENSWEHFRNSWLDSDIEIMSAIAPIHRQILKGRVDVNEFADRANRELAEKFPDVYMSFYGLKKAIEFLKSKEIQWWHHSGSKLTRNIEDYTLDGIVEGNTLVDNGYGYAYYRGRVIGVDAGFNNVFQTVGVFVEVEHEPHGQVINHPFEAMYDIELLN